ncbi:MAG: FAD-dependent oxidoreductase, partial [Clostridia bacterium]|nr:FAD-dependent oxidoreductase [Clostridia bacterium]
VYLVHRRDELRADKTLADRLKSSTVTPIWNSVVTRIDGEEKVSQITLKHTKNGTLSTVSVDGVFVAIGQSPNSNIFKNLDHDEHGYIITDEDMRTSEDGIFCAGDIRKKSLRQVVTACADGAIAASTIAKELL